MAERFGFKGFVLLVSAAVMVALQVLVLIQKHHDGELLIDEVRRTDRNVAAAERGIKDLVKAIGAQSGATQQLVAALRDSLGGTKTEMTRLEKDLQVRFAELTKVVVAGQAESGKALADKLAAIDKAIAAARADTDKAIRESRAESDKAFAARFAEIEAKIAAEREGLEKLLKARETDLAHPPGDWLVWSLPAEPKNLNPLTSRDLYSRYVKGYGKIFEALATYDLDTLELKPLLAQKWERSADGLVYTVTLRGDAKFSDGVPVTADDVVFSFNTIKNPKIDCPDLRSYYDKVASVEKIDPLTVRIRFSEPYFLAAETALDTEVLPRHVYEPFVRDDPERFNKIRDNPIVGTGPYLLQRWNTGQEIVLVRNENYWGRKPALDRIVFKFIKSPQAEFQALRKGEIDMMAPTPQQYDQCRGDAAFLKEFHIVKYLSPLSGYSYIAYNQENTLFQDARVRRAFTLALDRESIIKNVLYGVGKVAYGTFYQEGRQTPPDLKPWPYDLEQAKALLAEAGWRDTDGDGILDKDGRKFAFEYMLTTDNPIGEQIARYFKDQMQKLGIHVSLAPYEWSVFLERLNEHKFEATSLAWGGGGPESDPFQIWHSSQSKDRGSNFISWKNVRADELIEKARVELDPVKRNAMFHEFSRILHQEQPYTFLVARESIGFIHRRFENVKVHKLRLNPLEWYVPRERQLRGK